MILSVLFGSRARGDYAEGRSDVDILLVQEDPPTEEQRRRVALRPQSLSTSLYRGYLVPVQVIWFTLEEFNKRRRGVNDVAAQALDHGIILSNSHTDYGTWSRRAQTFHNVRWARRHLEFFLERQAESEPKVYQVGVQAYAAMQAALRAVVYASGEWCPDVYDIGMLIDFAARADVAFTFRPAIDGDVYSQYSFPREGLPIDRPCSVSPIAGPKWKGTSARCWTGYRWSGSPGGRMGPDVELLRIVFTSGHPGDQCLSCW